MRVLVVGSTGVLGRHVIPRLFERGHTVRTLVRRAEQAEALRRLGAEPVLGDILEPDSLLKAAPGCEAALHLATAIPKGSVSANWSRNDRIRREGTANLADEATPLQPAPYIQSAAEMEDLVRASALEWSILRGGAFYGPGTGAEEGWREEALRGTLPRLLQRQAYRRTGLGPLLSDLPLRPCRLTCPAEHIPSNGEMCQG